MSDQILRMNVPPDQSLHQFFHSPKRSYPGAIDRLLSMDDIRTWIEGAGSAFSYECDFAPFSGRTYSKLSSCIVCRSINGSFNALAIRNLQNLFQCILSRFKHIIGKSQLLCKINPVIVHFNTDQLIGSQCLGKHQSCQSYRSKTCD